MKISLKNCGNVSRGNGGSKSNVAVQSPLAAPPFDACPSFDLKLQAVIADGLGKSPYKACA
jgi:hypothetical protein